MKRFLFYGLLLVVHFVQGQELVNFFLEPTEDPNELILETHLFHYGGAGLIDSEITIEAGEITVNLCYALSSVAINTYDIQQFPIDIPVNPSSFNLQINLSLFDGVTPCNFNAPYIEVELDFDMPYDPTATTWVPDPVFERYLEGERFGDDTIGNQLVYTHRFINLARLNMNFSDIEEFGLGPIESLQGIEHLSRLQSLFAEGNQIEFFDATQHPDLLYLWVPTNPLLELDLSLCSKLEWCLIGSTLIDQLDLSQATDLEWLVVGSPNLTALDLSANTGLYNLGIYDLSTLELDLTGLEDLLYLRINNNSLLETLLLPNNEVLQYMEVKENAVLASLEVPSMPGLLRLHVEDNESLAEIDISGAAQLEILTMINNQVVELDLSQNPVLEQALIFNNALTVLDARNGNNDGLDVIGFGNPDLFCVSVDDPMDPPNWTFDNDVVYDADCEEDNALYFPDPNFHEALLYEAVADYGDGQLQNVDLDNDGLIYELEVATVQRLVIPGRAIESFQGLEFFFELQHFNGSDNLVTDLNLFDLPHFQELVFENNLLDQLYLDGNPELRSIDLSGNVIEDLHIRENPWVEFLDVSDNMLDFLDLRNQNHEALAFMDARQNELLSCIRVHDPEWAELQENWLTDPGVEYGINNCLLGLDDIGLSIGLYPNPASDQFHIESTEPIDRIKLYDVAGQLVLETTRGDQPIELGSLPSGLYFVRVETGSNRATQKLIIR